MIRTRNAPRARTTPLVVVVLACSAACSALLAAQPGQALASGYNGQYKPAPIIGGGEGNVKSQDIEPIENLGQTIPKGLSFVDGHGKTVRITDVLGQGMPVLVTLGYYKCPMLCNLVHEGLAKSIKKAGLVLGRDFLGFSASVDPKEDPKSANTNQGRLLRSIGAQETAKWPFVMIPPNTAGLTVADDGRTGPAKELSDALGFRFMYDKESKQFAHAAVAFVLTPEGKISRYVYGVDFEPRDLKFALIEAGGGRVGTTLDRVLLSCFKYDPMTHKYTPFAFGFVRIGAFLSFAALASLLALLWRKELQMRRERRTA